MTTNALLLAALALAIALCALCTKLSHRLGIPALALFSLIGMLFGSDGVLGIPFADAAMAEQLCSLALVPILFYGGFGTNWKTARWRGGPSSSPAPGSFSPPPSPASSATWPWG